MENSNPITYSVVALGLMPVVRHSMQSGRVSDESSVGDRILVKGVKQLIPEGYEVALLNRGQLKALLRSPTGEPCSWKFDYRYVQSSGENILEYYSIGQTDEGRYKDFHDAKIKQDGFGVY